MTADGGAAAGPDPAAPAASLRFDGKVAVVTGGARGIGRACVTLLAERGAHVVLDDTGVGVDGEPGDADLAGALAGELAAAGLSVVATAHDTATPAGARSVVQDAVAAFGRLDVVVANAGISWHVDLEALTPEELARAMAVNAEAPLWLAQSAWPHLAAAGSGRIVTVASAGLFGYPGRVHYLMSKAAVLGLTRSLALEGRGAGIAVNGVLPWAATRMALNREPGGWMDRHLPPEGVAAAVGWLAHDRCPASGELFASAGRHLAPVVLGVGPGVALDELTPEAIARRGGDVRVVEPLLVPGSTADYVERLVRPALEDPHRG